MQVEQKRKERELVSNRGAVLAEMLKAGCWQVGCGTVLILILPSRTHDQCSRRRAKHLKHDAIEARGTGPAGIWRSGGSITAESFYNMEPRKAPETWRCGLGEYVGPSVEDI
jgi:hypothetical protein